MKEGDLQTEMRSVRLEKRKEAYRKRMEYLKENPGPLKILHIMNRTLTVVVFFLYPLLLGWLFWKRGELLFAGIAVPLDSFIIVSVFRYLVDRKRPYEEYGIAPAIAKETKGKSFPSRHVFSIAIIAVSYLYLFPFKWVGVLLLLATAFLAAVRVVSGVHYLSDVLVGAIIGVLAGVIGYGLLL